MTPLFKKLNYTAQPCIVVLNAPPEFEPELAALDGVEILRSVPAKTPVAFAIAFAVRQAELDDVSHRLTKAAEGDATLWFTYPKQTSKRYKCEFNRDSGWSVLGAAGFECVRMVAINEDWSAMRFRRVEHIKTLNRHPARTAGAAGRERASASRQSIGSGRKPAQ